MSRDHDVQGQTLCVPGCVMQGRLAMLGAHVTARLTSLLTYLRARTGLRCRRCAQILCAHKDVFIASRRGAQQVFANAAGEAACDLRQALAPCLSSCVWGVCVCVCSCG